jgi:hypothetical protein
MEMLNCSILKFIPVIPQIAVWTVPKVTFASGNLAIDGRSEDLNIFRELLWALII